MDPVKPLKELEPEVGLQLFTLGGLVVAREMAQLLDGAGFYIQETELLDARSWPRQSGLPVVRVLGVPGLFFSPTDVVAFMNAWVDATEQEQAQTLSWAAGSDLARNAEAFSMAHLWPTPFSRDC
jgi:hypothetical protein